MTTTSTHFFCVRVFVAVFAALSLTSVASAQSTERITLDDLTWTEVAAALKSGKTTVIVPIGGTEQNGPHMALGKHNARVRILAEKIARELGNALVAPVVAYVPEGTIDPPSSHMRFAGTISVPERTFEATLESIARSLKRHGFRDVVFIGDHGGYQKSEQIVAARLNREWASTPTRAHAIVEYYDVTQKRYADLLRERGISDREIGSHAGLADTSLTLAIDPTLVRRDELRLAAAGAPNDGVRGDPARSSAELGAIGVDVIVAATVQAIRAAVAHR